METPSEENYLKAIFKLSQLDIKKITPTAIAEEVIVNPASVIDMLKKLAEQGYITYDKKEGATLSAKGEKIALTIVRKHRLWEVFLFEKLKYSWDEIHDMAEQLEHIKQYDLADRLDEFLEFPEFDPHGDPIPKSSGILIKLSRTLLSEKDIGSHCEVIALKDTTPEFLQYLKLISIEINTKLLINDKIAFDGSLIVSIEGRSPISVSEKLANSIFVKQ